MSTAFKTLLALLGIVLAGALVFGLVRVGTATEPDATLAVRPDSTTSFISSTSTTFVSTTTTLPPTTTPTPPPRETLVVHGTGDVNLDPGYIPNAGSGYAHAWDGLRGLFADDDLTVINLECAPSDIGTPEPKEYLYRCPIESLGSLAEAGIEVANMGNNHSGDFGKDAFLDGRANLIAAGVAPVGAGADIIFGHHSHRLQPHEMVGDSAVFWGLGNFVWPSYSTTGVARAVVHPDGTIEACLIPAFVETSGHPVLTGEPKCGPAR